MTLFGTNTRYDYYNDYGCGYFYKFVRLNPEFRTGSFEAFVSDKNRGDRDDGEFQDIAKHEVLRLAAEFEEHEWRFPGFTPGYGAWPGG